MDAARSSPKKISSPFRRFDIRFSINGCGHSSGIQLQPGFIDPSLLTSRAEDIGLLISDVENSGLMNRFMSPDRNELTASVYDIDAYARFRKRTDKAMFLHQNRKRVIPDFIIAMKRSIDRYTEIHLLYQQGK